MKRSSAKACGFHLTSKMKRGLSSVISAVLLIALVLVGGIATFVFSKGIVERAQKEASKEKMCSEASFSVGDFCHGIRQVYHLETGDLEQKPYIRFNGRSNIVNSKIDGFIISVDYGGNTIPISTLPYSEIEGGETKTLVTDIIENIDTIKQIKVIPKINYNGKIVVCNKNDEIFEWSRVEQC